MKNGKNRIKGISDRKPRAKITAEMEAVILLEAVRRPLEPRTELAVRLEERFAASGEVAPAVEVLEKRISAYRKKKTGPQEEAWSTATLDMFPLAPEVLPFVVEVLRQALVAQKKGEARHLTVREVKWLARFAGMESLFPAIGLAFAYAAQEFYDEMRDEPPEVRSAHMMALDAIYLLGLGIRDSFKEGQP